MNKKKQTEIIKQNLKVDFSHDEIHEFGNQLANITNEVKELTNAKKSAMSDFKAKIDGKTADAESLSTKIANGYEYRNVECEVRFNKPNTGRKQIVRKDTGEMVSEESMTAEELQLEMEI